ncbi:hypothetical protein [Streptomyces sp. NPDC048663]|uniref:hypothetical protein n=1 Tax=Streptomyces sp. NPDC048663 TaxID=3155638 RepID=UPI0034199E13
MIDPKDINLPTFLADWYDAPTRDRTPLLDVYDWLPAPLREWHELATQWDRRLTYTTSMIPPEKIRLSEDGKAIFMIDSTGDWRWCIDLNDTSGVFDAEEYEPWERGPEQLGDFLIHCTVREVIYGAAAKLRAIAVSDETLEKIIDPLEEIAFGAWKWPAPGYRYFLGNATLAEIIRAESGDGWNVEVVSPKLNLLQQFKEIPDARWRVRGT